MTESLTLVTDGDPGSFESIAEVPLSDGGLLVQFPEERFEASEIYDVHHHRQRLKALPNDARPTWDVHRAAVRDLRRDIKAYRNSTPWIVRAQAKAEKSTNRLINGIRSAFNRVASSKAFTPAKAVFSRGLENFQASFRPIPRVPEGSMFSAIGGDRAGSNGFAEILSAVRSAYGRLNPDERYLAGTCLSYSAGLAAAVAAMAGVQAGALHPISPILVGAPFAVAPFVPGVVDTVFDTRQRGPVSKQNKGAHASSAPITKGTKGDDYRWFNISLGVFGDLSFRVSGWKKKILSEIFMENAHIRGLGLDDYKFSVQPQPVPFSSQGGELSQNDVALA